MEDYSKFKEDFNRCFQNLNKLTEDSFLLMDHNPGIREEIANLWKKSILKFISDTYKVSEKHNNKDVIKIIIKALMFGR